MTEKELESNSGDVMKIMSRQKVHQKRISPWCIYPSTSKCEIEISPDQRRNSKSRSKNLVLCVGLSFTTLRYIVFNIITIIFPFFSLYIVDTCAQ